MVDVGLPVSGAIPRVERQESHCDFLWAVRPPAAMVDLTHARRICIHDEQFFPIETDVVLTTTISDQKLARFTFEDELRIIRTLEPDCVLPFDFPVYGDMPAEKRLDHIQQVKRGTEELSLILGDTPEPLIEHFHRELDIDRSLLEPTQDTTIIPLLKGTTDEEWETMYETPNQLSSPLIAKYGVQYMTVGGSGNHPQLCEDLNTIETVTNNHPTLVIGLLSPTGKYSLEGVPDNVVAAAGMNQWVKRVRPKSTSPSGMREAFADLYNTVADTLDISSKYHPSIAATNDDSPPTLFSKSPGEAASENLSPTIAGAAGDEEYGFGGRKRPIDSMSPREAAKRQ